MSRAVLKITDGTPVNTMDLLSPRLGYILCDWRPSRPEFDLTNDHNWFSGVETPAFLTQKPAIDVFTFNARHTDVDQLIEDEKKLSRILYFASLYWTGERSVRRPFYIIAKSKKETKYRYATIFSTQLHDDSNPYSSPFFSRKPASTGLTVPISHGPWLDYIPGGDGLPMYENVTSYINHTYEPPNATNFLNDDMRIMLPNFVSHNAITHIFRGGDEPNMIDQAQDIGYDLFVTGGSSSYTYIGMEISEEAYVSFKSAWPGLTMNITTSAAYAPTVGSFFQWQVYLETGPGVYSWVTIDVDDGTEEFSQPGTVIFDPSSYGSGKYFWGWAQFNDIGGYWVRVRPWGLFTSVPAVSVRHPTAVTTGHFDVLLAADEMSDILSPPLPDSPPKLPPNSPPPIDPDPGIQSAPLEPPIAQIVIVSEDSEGTAGNIPFRLTFDSAESTSSANARWDIFVTPPKYFLNLIGETVSVPLDYEGPYSYFFHSENWYGDTTHSIRGEGHWYVTDPVWKVAIDFYAWSLAPDIGEVITFDISNSVFDTPSDTIDHSVWQWGDYTQTIDAGAVLNGSHAYTQPGVYNVALEVHYTSGRVATTTKFGMVDVKSDVTASFLTKSRRGFAPFNPEFDASYSTSSSGTIVSYEWWFGDGTTGAGVKPNKSYEAQGVYSVTLKVTDSFAGTSTLSVDNFIYVDNRLLYPGDSGIFMQLDFKPSAIDIDPYVANKMYIGAKSMYDDDVAKFQGFIPVYKNNSTPVGVGLNMAPYGSIVALESAYTGFVYEAPLQVTGNPEVGTEERYTSLYFGTNVYKRYRGAYRIFLRMSSDVNVAKGELYFSAGVSSEALESTALSRTKRVSMALHPSYITVVDLGSVVLGGKEFVVRNLDIFWQFFGTKSGQKIRMFDVVLIPQDEWFTELDFSDIKWSSGQNYELSTGSLTYTGELESKIWSPQSNFVTSIPVTIPGKPLATTGKDMRFTVFSTRYDNYIPRFQPEIPVEYSSFDWFYELANVTKVNRYFSSIGDR